MSPGSVCQSWMAGSNYGDDVENAGEGSVMVWSGISITGKTRLVIIEGHLNAVTYQDDILQLVAIPYLHNLGPNSIL